MEHATQLAQKATADIPKLNKGLKISALPLILFILYILFQNSFVGTILFVIYIITLLISHLTDFEIKKAVGYCWNLADTIVLVLLLFANTLLLDYIVAGILWLFLMAGYLILPFPFLLWFRRIVKKDLALAEKYLAEHDKFEQYKSLFSTTTN